MKLRALALATAGVFMVACGSDGTSLGEPPRDVPLVGFSWEDNAIGFRDEDGRRFAFECAPPAPPIAFVYGTDVYTDDSSICFAGVHAGVITREEGGYVVIEIQPGRETYEGTERNGIRSQDFASYSGSFTVIP
jgi:hypothetical protein